MVVSRAERVERVEDKECGNGIRRVGRFGLIFAILLRCSSRICYNMRSH